MSVKWPENMNWYEFETDYDEIPIIAELTRDGELVEAHHCCEEGIWRVLCTEEAFKAIMKYIHK